MEVGQNKYNSAISILLFIIVYFLYVKHLGNLKACKLTTNYDALNTFSLSLDTLNTSNFYKCS